MDSTMITAIIVALLAISEVLAFIPSVKANSIFQFIVEMLKKIVGK
jgi:hypothetical protein